MDFDAVSSVGTAHVAYCVLQQLMTRPFPTLHHEAPSL
jgi:hypothetical protein